MPANSRGWHTAKLDQQVTSLVQGGAVPEAPFYGGHRQLLIRGYHRISQQIATGDTPSSVTLQLNSLTSTSGAVEGV
eukprot:6080799-Amphidinium_carterae.1